MRACVREGRKEKNGSKRERERRKKGKMVISPFLVLTFFFFLKIKRLYCNVIWHLGAVKIDAILNIPRSYRIACLAEAWV